MRELQVRSSTPLRRHSRVGGNPALDTNVVAAESGIPAFAGMTVWRECLRGRINV